MKGHPKVTEFSERKQLCRRIILCGMLTLFLIYLIAGVPSPQEADYFGTEISLSAEDEITFADLVVDILLNENRMVCPSENVSIRNGGTYIRASGAYRLTGKLTDGSVYIAAADGGIAHLLLDGASLCGSGPAVYAAAAKKSLSLL